MAAEKEFENKIKKFLKDNGVYYIKTHGDRFSRVGTPDILACVNGRFVGIEVKAANGRPSPLQIEHINQINEAGGYATIVYPKDWPETKKTLELLLNM